MFLHFVFVVSFFLSQFLFHPFDLLSVSSCKRQLFSMYAVFDLLGYVRFIIGKTFHIVLSENLPVYAHETALKRLYIVNRPHINGFQHGFASLQDWSVCGYEMNNIMVSVGNRWFDLSCVRTWYIPITFVHRIAFASVTLNILREAWKTEFQLAVIKITQDEDWCFRSPF